MLAHMSTDYYARLEQQRGPQPSEQMLAALARGLRLSLDERDHLFRLAGQTPAPRARRTEHVNPALMRVLDRLDTPAQVMSDLGVTLVQNDLAIALVGDQTRHTGLARHLGFRWFTDPAEREIYPAEDHAHHSRVYAAGMRGHPRPRHDRRAGARPGRAAAAAQPGVRRSLWAEHEIAVNFSERKRLVHPAARAAGAVVPGPDQRGRGAGPARLHRHARDGEPRQVAPARTDEPGIDAPFIERPREAMLFACPTLTFLT